ncbi:MAG TPA: SPOR domain-containing protein [Allosphingosinicella sp.]|nr:SPOR domain-containing protein [Allosphingosinicella sp.]
MRGIRHSLALLAAGSIMGGGAAAAQQRTGLPPGAVVQPIGPDDGAELRRYLTQLADNPRSLDALIGAGRAALQSGDAEAALSFFARADELSPRNARIRGGMASSLVRMGRAQQALGLFAEAVSLGAPVAEIAADRGLAYDILGDPRRAQQDYTLALRQRDTDEVRRRMALSLAISGQRDAALRMLDPQLRRNERAAWRTQAFVLALTGDSAGATRTAQGTMPAGAAQAMAPFLARLAALSPQQKALAVHFGQFPANGRAFAGAAHTDTTADPGAVALAMGGAPRAAAPATGRSQAPAAATRRRPGSEQQARSSAPRTAAPASGRRRVADVRDSSDPYGLRGLAAPVRRQPRPQPARQETEPQPARQEPQPARQEPGSPPVEVAEVSTRWAGAPVIPQQQAQPAVTQPPSLPPPVAREAPAPAMVQPAQTQPVQPAPTQPAQTQPAPTQPVPTLPVQQVPSPAPAAEAAPQPSASSTAPPLVQSETPPAPSAVQTTPIPASSLPGPGAIVEAPPANPAPAAEIAPALATPAEASPGFTLTQQESRPAEPQPEPPREPLADIASVVNSLPSEPEPSRPAPAPEPARPTPPRQRQAEPTRPARAATPAAARPRPAAPAHPSRHWVQIAGGADRSALPREFARLRAQAPELANRTAWTTPLNATNRLLVGPFASAREAQQFVNQLSQHGVSAFAWTSPAGQEIERLGR